MNKLAKKTHPTQGCLSRKCIFHLLELAKKTLPARSCLLVIAFAVAAGCSLTPYRNGFPSQEGWAILPVIPLDSTDNSIQVERMLTVLLAANGVQNVELPPSTETSGQSTLVNNAHRLKNASQWARQHAIKLGLNGSIDQWHQEPDGRFSVGLTLKLTDVDTGEVLWTTTGQGEGRPGEKPLDVTRNLTRTLLSGLPLTENPSASGWRNWFDWLPDV